MPGPVVRKKGKLMYHRGRGRWAVYSQVRDRKIRARHPSRPRYPQIGDIRRRKRSNLAAKLLKGY